MSDEASRIEFLEPHEEPDAIAWLDADDEENLGSRGSSRLPSRKSPRLPSAPASACSTSSASCHWSRPMLRPEK